jgi:hypothetical protein
VFEGGDILDPNNGKVYRVKLKLIDDGSKLDVRGYIGTPMLGRTQTWVAPNEHGSQDGTKIQRQEGRRPRRRRHGRADRRPPRQRARAGDPVRPAREGRPKNGIVTKAVENLKKLKPAPLGIPRRRR